MVHSHIFKSVGPPRFLTFIQTAVYVAAARKLLDDEGQRLVEKLILSNPKIGAMEFGVRKLRVGLPGTGKRGGARVIYHYVEKKGRVYLLDIYSKSDRPALSRAEKNMIRALSRKLEDEP
jgi:hypothetical protein